MPSTNIRSVVTRTLALPVLLLLALAVALSVWIVHLLRSEAWVQHSYDVIGEISETQKLVIDQETGLRAYMLTADPAFLRPYVESSAQFGNSLESLREETSDNPKQRQRIDELRQRYLQWRNHAEEERQIVEANREGQVRDASTRNRMTLLKQQMDQIRADFTSLHAEEHRLLRERLEAAKRANLTLFTAGALLLLVCAALMVLFLRAQLRLIDQIYQAKVDESERARLAAEALAAEVQEQAAAMEEALLSANRERDQAVRTLRESASR
jgi:CHASE3 domain sensor protein